MGHARRPRHDGSGLGYRGELVVDGLTWLRHRAYDPATRTFLQPDPLPPVPGTAYAANPYHYAGNDPVNALDPLGLRPLTDNVVTRGLDSVGDWLGNNWKTSPAAPSSSPASRWPPPASAAPRASRS